MLSNAPVSAALPASDIQRAKKFYQETLGLEVMTDNEGGTTFKGGNSTYFLIYPSSFAGTNKATAAGWDVEDIEAEMNELRQKGVIFEEYDLPGIKTVNGIADFGGEKAAWFKDSEDNILALSQRAK